MFLCYADSYLGTASIDVFSFVENNRRVYLIDTPGFNDTHRPEIETLEILATYLGASYANGVRIHGLIILHPITDNRMPGSSLRNLQMIKSVYGWESYANVAIVTTMWPEVSDNETEKFGAREHKLMVNESYFGDLVAMGATKFRYGETGRRNSYNSMASARDIVNHLIARLQICPPSELQLQRELINEGKCLEETAAGIAIAERLAKTRQVYKHELRGLSTKLQCQLDNGAHACQLNEHEAAVDEQYERAAHEKKTLRKTMQDLHQDGEKALKGRIDEVDRQLLLQLIAQEEELRSIEMSLLELGEHEEQREITESFPELEHEIRQPQRHTEQPQTHREGLSREAEIQEELIRNLRRELAKAQKAYQSFHGHAGNFWNGTTNGVAAGVTSGVVGIGELPYFTRKISWEPRVLTLSIKPQFQGSCAQ
ncbi:hypothetical protein NM208_g5040 [Fusarium decemcellulare]|uniref:Uncharacterized protein n=1 Tax=Fusarium decemcellulare TaxID=57161 RepID=A0ACC1SIF5_9HYPO|nr:hypothetical protein NM208_g5040 [Fusarium decemcellulare]